MYTGIVQHLGVVQKLSWDNGIRRIRIKVHSSFTDQIQIGASVSVNGVCLTVTQHCRDALSFHISKGTLETTNLSHLSVDDRVNLERSHKSQEENGGHGLAGHVCATVKIVELILEGSDRYLLFRAPSQYAKYIFPFGFVGINGVSLTVTETKNQKNVFKINFIPETIKRTNFSNYQKNDLLNLEIDQQSRIMVDTIERVLKENLKTLSR